MRSSPRRRPNCSAGSEALRIRADRYRIRADRKWAVIRGLTTFSKQCANVR